MVSLLRTTERYAKSQVNTDAKIRLLWRNIKDVLGIEESREEPGVMVDVQDNLFYGSVQVTFAAYVQKKVA